MNSSKNILLLKSFNLVIISLIFYFSIVQISVIPIETDKLPNDKILHLGAYFILSLSTVLARWKITTKKNNRHLSENKVAKQKYSMVIVFCLIYGIVIEVIQSIVPSRNFDILDIITNGVGIFAGILIHFIFLKLFEGYNTQS